MKRKSLGFSIVFLALLFTVNPAAPFCRLACAADQGENTISIQGRCLDGHDLQTRLAGTGVTVNIKYADMEKRTWVQSSSNKGICDERGEFSFPNIPFDPSKTRAHVQVIVTKQGFIGGLHVFVPDPKEKKIHFSFGLLDRNEKALVKGVIRDLITGKSILCGSVDLLLSSPGEKGTKSEIRHRIAADKEGRFVAKVDPLYVNSLDRSTSFRVTPAMEHYEVGVKECRCGPCENAEQRREVNFAVLVRNFKLLDTRKMGTIRGRITANGTPLPETPVRIELFHSSG